MADRERTVGIRGAGRSSSRSGWKAESDGSHGLCVRQGVQIQTLERCASRWLSLVAVKAGVEGQEAMI